jgi:6-phosphogluconolactonase
MQSANIILKPGDVEIKVVKDLEGTSQTAANLIAKQFADSGSSAGPLTVALSGGSTPRSLYERLGHEPSVRDRIPWNRLHFFWGDERHVPPGDSQSNYRMALETLFSSAPVPEENLHRIPAEDPDAAAVAENYERDMRLFFTLKNGQLPRFDCVLLGIGSDGHTASLFPETAALKETRRLVVANRVEKLQTHRITLTVPVFNNAALVIFLVSGREKAAVLKEILEGEYHPERLPAQLIRPATGKLIWLVDQAAASRLTDVMK